MFSGAGDFAIDSQRSDLADSKDIAMRDLLQRMNTQITSPGGSWLLQPLVGAGLDRFLGMPNNARTGQLVRQAIMGSLVGSGLLRADEVKVEVFPLSEHVLAALIEAVPNGSSTRVRLSYTVNLQDSTIVPRNF